VTKFEGEVGNFSATLSNGESVSAGSVVLATGFTHFDSVNKPEWGFGTFPDVLTTTQMEQMVGDGKIACPSDGRVPERVAILLCVGSRDRQIGREWCSKICCTVSANLAMEIKELSPQTDVFIYYMDIRTFGLYEDRFYWKSQEEFKVKYVKARIAEVTASGDGRLLVKGEDTLVKRPIVIPFDIVVHAIGMDPNEENPEISRVFGVGLEKHGYIDRAEHYTNTCGTTRRGIYSCGAAYGPETIDDSISQGAAAAMRAIADISSAAASA
jgi:heterodisulfide reductase subunit A